MRTSGFKMANMIVLGLSLALYAGAASAQSKIGVAATVKNQVSSSGRALSAGSDVHARELIKTGDASAASLLFLDQTNLNIGPKSEVTLDQFVYDPNRRLGSVVLNAGRGVFRFVSGSQDSKSYKINTAIANIGVRGTIFGFANSPVGLAETTTSGSVSVFIKPSGPTVEVPAGWSIFVYPNGTYQKFQSSESLNFFRNAGLDQMLLEEYATFTGQGNIFGGLRPAQCRGNSCTID